MGVGKGSMRVYIEAGTKRTFAAALDWPGWARSGRDEAAALSALLTYGPRYARAVRSARLRFTVPGDLASFAVIERLKGNATTDYGAPGAWPALDGQPLSEEELHRQLALLRAAWRAFDEAAEAARGTILSTGPRGGGRDLASIVLHTFEAEQAYLGRLGWKVGPLPPDPEKARVLLRSATVAGLKASARGEIPATGPRGGRRWSAQSFIRRAGWHALDHAWEIEDRSG